MSGSLTLGGGETFPAFPVHAQPTIVRIWKEAHAEMLNNTCCLSYTANTIPADALATLGASETAGMVLTSKDEILLYYHILVLFKTRFIMP